MECYEKLSGPSEHWTFVETTSPFFIALRDTGRREDDDIVDERKSDDSVEDFVVRLSVCAESKFLNIKK